MIHTTDNHTENQSSRSSWYSFVQHAPGKELFTILDMLDIVLGMMAAISVEEKGPATYVVSAVVEHLRAWGRKKVIFRIDGEPAIRALGVAIQHARSEETVIECRPKWTCEKLPNQLEGEGKDGGHDSVSTAAMVGQTL